MRRREKILTRLFWTSIACIVLSLLALLALKRLRVTGAAACAYAIGAALLAGGMLLDRFGDRLDAGGSFEQLGP